MKIRSELIQEIRDLVLEGKLEEARILAGHVKLLKEIFNLTGTLTS